MNLKRYNRALQIASLMHDGQAYKYNPDMPFISHPLFTAGILQEYDFDEDTIIAAILHDTVEDTDYTIDDLAEDFGDKVADIVEELTFDQALPWKDRQYLMQDKIAGSSPSAKAIKAADIIHHMVLLIDEETQKPAIDGYLAKHSQKDIAWKYKELIKSIKKGWNHPIVQETERIFEKFKEISSGR